MSLSKDNELFQAMPGNASELARKTKRNYANVYRSLQRLMEQGRVTVRYENEVKVYHWIATEPGKNSPAVANNNPELPGWIYKLHEHLEAGQNQIEIDTDKSTDELNQYVQKHSKEALTFLLYYRELFNRMV